MVEKTFMGSHDKIQSDDDGSGACGSLSSSAEFVFNKTQLCPLLTHCDHDEQHLQRLHRKTGRRRWHQQRGSIVKGMKVVVVLMLMSLSERVGRVDASQGRAQESMHFDGKQGDFSEVQPPDPGYIFITPRRVRENAEPMWFEFRNAFTIEAWIRPERLFLGTQIEGGVLTCLVTDIPLSRYSGFGVIVSGTEREGKLIFRATQGTNQASLFSVV
jgi:hypothetical protein